MHIFRITAVAIGQTTKPPQPCTDRRRYPILAQVPRHPLTQGILLVLVGLDLLGHTAPERETITALDLFTGNTLRVLVTTEIGMRSRLPPEEFLSAHRYSH